MKHDIESSCNLKPTQAPHLFIILPFNLVKYIIIHVYMYSTKDRKIVYIYKTRTMWHGI